VEVNAPFEPQGEVSKRQMLVDLLSQAPVDSVVPYAEMEALIEGNRSVVQACVHQAQSALSRDHNVSLKAVRNVGYRVVPPMEHVDLAVAQQRKARRGMGRGRRHVDYVDMSELTEPQRQVISNVAGVLARQQAQIQRIDRRQAILESAFTEKLQGDVKRDAATQSRLSRIEAELARLNESNHK
jgi:hypothetical protein